MKSDSTAPERQSSDWLKSWHVSAGNNADYHCIDGLRGIAILLVVLSHTLYTGASIQNKWILALFAIFSRGTIGVFLFFALSGFLISLPFYRQTAKDSLSRFSFCDYAWRRFWKIYPPLALIILLLTPATIYFSKDWSVLFTAGEWLSGVAFFVPVSDKLNPALWSLVIEVEFYLLLPLIFFLFRKVSLKYSIWLIPALFLFGPDLVRLGFYGGNYFSHIHPMVRAHFPQTLNAFAFGLFMAALASRQKLHGKWIYLGPVGLFLLCVIWFSAGYEVFRPQTGQLYKTGLHWLSLLASGMCLAHIANPSFWTTRLLCFKPLCWLGLISYELYLLHQPLAGWMRHIVGPCNGHFGKYIFTTMTPIMISLLLAALIYRYFSLPILKAKRPRHPAQ